ncbi:thiamine-phosphate diphosphorylase [Hydrogenispora ethanolica]|jgi:thiamine-phosphate pyrophosphorylase|uniref:Thiamine-phosphate synthase n=1 Tax=Hydrogenispora ethanolica TaxID=1082276 RepID=A0A4R1R1U3_HYDET|nr:thiamine phosphate synthase [Hydrogenispora ethanolica]TCL59262.1 thiamine-phosphate diphosphorylase [Hydrogenispora ethanolica]
MRREAAIDYSLYLVTDSGLLAGRDFCQSVAAALRGGVSLVQLREKDRGTRDFFELAVRVKAVTDHYGVPLIINDRLDIALAVDAAGLHIGQEDLPAGLARRLLGSGKILGVSAGTLDEALAAEDAGADYLGIGAVFPTGTKQDAREVGLAGLRAVTARVGLPVVAIGGIQEQNLQSVLEQEVAGVALVSAILCQPEIEQAARRLRGLVDGWRNLAV